MVYSKDASFHTKSTKKTGFEDPYKKLSHTLQDVINFENITLGQICLIIGYNFVSDYLSV